MKKSIIILFAVFYLLISTGAALNLHYCGGSLKSISLVSTNPKSCCKGKMKKGCCQNKQLILKTDNKQQTNKVDKINHVKEVSIAKIETSQFTYTRFYRSTTSSKKLYDHSPPILNGVSIYITNNVFII